MHIKQFVAVLLAVCALSTVTPTSASADEAKSAAIVELLEMTGAMDLGKQMMQQMLPQIWGALRNSNPEIPEDLIEAMDDEFKAAFDEAMPELTAMMVLAYGKHFTVEELNELILFYKTDLGEKLISVMPALMTELVMLGQTWGSGVLTPRVMERLKERLRKEGYDI